ncbi:methyltransferase family protein [[Eubacterium] cellulosolvens]
MFNSIKSRAILLVPPVVFSVLASSLALGYLISMIFAIPLRFGFTLTVRLGGLFVLVIVSLFFAWFFKYRKPIDVLISTYVTILKAMKGAVLRKPKGRTEKFVIKGPYKYVRHPLYFGVVLIVISLWLLLDYSALLITALLLLLWFNFVVASFEEKELKAMFGKQYEQYSKKVPKIIPFTKYHKE